MSDVDDRLSEAYGALHAPDALKAAAIARIEARRGEESVASDGSDARVFAPLFVASGAAAEQPPRDGRVSAEAFAPARRRVPRARRSFSRKVAMAAVACAVFAAIGVGGFAYAMAPVARVGIDVNPSFELSVNRFDRVVDARAVNDDAAAVLDRVDIDGMACEEAMQVLADACEGYIGEGAVVDVGVACDDEARCAAIESAALRSFEREDAEVHCGRLTDEQCRAAVESGMGLGRYRVYEALVAQGVDISQEDAATMTMAELRAFAAQTGVDTCDSACAGHAGEQGSSCGSGHGRGCGHQGQGEGRGRQGA